MHGMLGFESAGKIDLHKQMSDQEQYYLDYLRQGAGFNNNSLSNSSSSLDINAYMMNQTEKAYESSGKSIYSTDLRIFILENELNLVKKYLRDLIS